MHYTSIENIHKVIDPLFYNDLRTAFEDCLEETNIKKRMQQLHALQDKMAALRFLDPACGRLKSDYRYSKDIVYNNFPWPSPTPDQQAKIEQSAQAILAVRVLYPDSSLADLYDPTLMPKELLQAHRQNDRAVMAAYGFSTKMTENECVAELFKRYSKMVK